MDPSHLLWPCLVILRQLPLWLLLLQGGEAIEILNGVFCKRSTTGKSVRVHTTIHGPRSCVACALICAKQRSATPTCVAFGCYGDTHQRGMKCDFYTSGPVVSYELGDEVFWMEETDVFHTVSIGGSKFSISLSSTRHNYHKARALCQSMSGHLLQFDSLDEYQAVQWLVGRHIYKFTSGSYVGVNDFEKEGRWVTDREGVPLDPVLWHFSPGEPNNVGQGEHCAVLLHSSMMLDDRDCSREYTVLCERD